MSDEIVLILSAFFASTISGFIGMVGGMLLLVVMSFYFTPAMLIPLHGIVQLASNGIRTFYFRNHLTRRIIAPFAVGSVVGALIGSQLVIALPEDTYRFVLGSFILIMTWLPKFKFAPRTPSKFFWVGSTATFLSLFVGATGPYIAPFFLRENLEKEQLVGNKGACQTLVHTFKILTFSILGFQFGEYLPLLVGMIVAVIIGNYVGKQFLKKVSKGVFIWIFRCAISLLAMRLVWDGVSRM